MRRRLGWHFVAVVDRLELIVSVNEKMSVQYLRAAIKVARTKGKEAVIKKNGRGGGGKVGDGK